MAQISSGCGGSGASYLFSSAGLGIALGSWNRLVYFSLLEQIRLVQPAAAASRDRAAAALLCTLYGMYAYMYACMHACMCVCVYLVHVCMYVFSLPRAREEEAACSAASTLSLRCVRSRLASSSSCGLGRFRFRFRFRRVGRFNLAQLFECPRVSPFCLKQFLWNI